jgi:hypothetical protein
MNQRSFQFIKLIAVLVTLYLSSLFWHSTSLKIVSLTFLILITAYLVYCFLFNLFVPINEIGTVYSPKPKCNKKVAIIGGNNGGVV